MNFEKMTERVRGFGGFLMTVKTGDDFAAAIRKKMAQEIADAQPVSRDDLPGGPPGN